MHFGENQLSRNLIGLSPLAPGHPPGFQPRWVRSSTRSYPRFNLLRARSSRFGSRTSDSNALFGLAFATHTPHGLCSPPATDSQTHFSIGTPSPHKKGSDGCRRTVSGTVSLPPGVLFTFPSRYWYAIGQTGIFRLTQRSGLIHAGIPRARALGTTRSADRRVQVRGWHPLRPGLQACSPDKPFSATAGRSVGTGTRDPTTPRAQPPTGITRNRFGLIRFRSPLLTEYPFLQVLRCFTSLRTPAHRRYRTMTAGGFPIRRP